MNPSTTLTAPSSSSNPPASTIRPRQRRLISGLDEELDSNPGASRTSRSTSPLPSPFASGATSPLPSKHPSRAPSYNHAPRSTASSNKPTHNGNKQSSADDPFTSLSGLWGNSWSALQNLASNVLGADVDDGHERRRKPFNASKRTGGSTTPSKWGPSTPAEPQIGVGTKEERESMVRAMKRKDLLAANGHLYADATGKFKRRNSDERISSSAPPGDAENRDALVYIHKVRPQDTLAGITIKYNCQAAVLRKANRMWPNDTVQIRKTLVIPVDACGIKGRLVPAPTQPEQEDLLGGDGDRKGETENTKHQPGSNGWSRARAPSDLSRPRSSSTSSKAEPDPPWIHDSWVLLPGDTEPTEIARLPRMTLGYFPPARRKSVTFSDATPSASLDIPRPSLSSPGQSTSEAGTSSPKGRPNRPRKQSITATFPLHGPGGVGTLGKNVRRPGPAQDGLNKLFASHLPSVAPPSGQEHFTPWTPALLDPSSSQDGVSTSGAINQSAGVGFDLEHVGGAIEAWARKWASKASQALNESSASQNSKALPIPGVGAEGRGVGDLIELQDDPFQIGDDERDNMREQRGRTGTIPAYGSTGRPDLPQSMRARDKSKGKMGKDDKDD